MQLWKSQLIFYLINQAQHKGHAPVSDSIFNIRMQLFKMEIEDFRERTTWKAALVIVLFLVICAATVYGIVMGEVDKHQWLQMYCDMNLITEFQGSNVTSIEEAGSLIGPVFGDDIVNIVSAGNFQYCSGYRITSGNKLYFLCDDGRLYELTFCRITEQNETILPFLPSPEIVYGD